MSEHSGQELEKEGHRIISLRLHRCYWFYAYFSVTFQFSYLYAKYRHGRPAKLSEITLSKTSLPHED